MRFLLILLVAFLIGGPALAQTDTPEGSQKKHTRQHDRPKHRPGDRPPLTEEQITEAIEVLSELRPRMAERLREIQETDPARVAEVVERQYPRVRMFLELKKREPELYKLRIRDLKLESKSNKLAKKLRAAKEAGG